MLLPNRNGEGLGNLPHAPVRLLHSRPSMTLSRLFFVRMLRINERCLSPSILPSSRQLSLPSPVSSNFICECSPWRGTIRGSIDLGGRFLFTCHVLPPLYSVLSSPASPYTEPASLRLISSLHLSQTPRNLLIRYFQTVPLAQLQCRHIGSASSLKPADMLDSTEKIQVQADSPPPTKRRRIAAPTKPRTTAYIDLENHGEQEDDGLERLISALRKKRKIVVIAGAGISVSAGSMFSSFLCYSWFPKWRLRLTLAVVPDFRSSTGLFATSRGQHKLKVSGKHLFDASVYKHDSSTESFHTMIRELAQMTSDAKPTPFHHMLASIASEGRLMRMYSTGRQ